MTRTFAGARPVVGSGTAQPLARGVVVVLVAGCSIALAGTSAWIAWRGAGATFASTSPLATAVFLAAGLSAVAAGVSSWARGRRPRFGVVLVAAGFAWLLAPWPLPSSGSSIAFTLGLAAGASFPAVAAHALLLFDRDALVRWERAVIVAGYLAWFGLLGIAFAATFEPASNACGLCPVNHLALLDAPAVAEATTRAGLVAASVATPGAVFAAAAALRAGSLARRRVAAPVLGPGAVLLGLIAADAWLRVAGVATPSSGAVHALRFGQALLLMAVAAGAALERVAVRRTRTRVVRLVAELARSSEGAGLRDVLASALRDPDLLVGYPLADGSVVDRLGREVALRQSPGRRTTRVERDGSVISVLDHRADLDDEAADVDEVVAAAGLGFVHERLLAEARANLAELRASRARLVRAADTERRRLERDLHDGAQQRLLGLSIALRLLGRTLGDDGDADAVAAVAWAEGEVRAALAELRDIAHGIYPAVLADEGIAAAVEGLVESSGTALEATELTPERFDERVETAAYDVVARSLADGGVDGAAAVAVTRRGSSVIVEISGVSLSADALEDIGDRVGAAGGTLVATTSARGHQTLRAEIPCAS